MLNQILSFLIALYVGSSWFMKIWRNIVQLLSFRFLKFRLCTSRVKEISLLFSWCRNIFINSSENWSLSLVIDIVSESTWYSFVVHLMSSLNKVFLFSNIRETTHLFCWKTVVPFHHVILRLWQSLCYLSKIPGYLNSIKESSILFKFNINIFKSSR